VSDTEQIYSLYVQANPVPDPGRLPATVYEAELLTIERSRTMDTQHRPEIREAKRPPRWRTAVITFAAVIVVVGATLGIAALIASDGDDPVATADTASTLTFDGATLTYRGPESLQAGTVVTVTLENASDEEVSFNWLRLRDEDMTVEEFLAAFQAGEDPVSDGQSLEPEPGPTPAQSVVEAELRLLIEGTYSFSAYVEGTDEQGLLVKDRYPAAVLIEVTGN